MIKNKKNEDVAIVAMNAIIALEFECKDSKKRPTIRQMYYLNQAKLKLEEIMASLKLKHFR